MCWETHVLFACGCEEVVQIKFCEHAVFPWLTNDAHPKGLPMEPTVTRLAALINCSHCSEEKVLANGGDGIAGVDAYKGKGKIKEVMDSIEEDEEEKGGEIARRMEELQAEWERQAAGFGEISGGILGGAGLGAGAGAFGALEDEHDEFGDDEDEEEDDGEVSLELDAPLLDELEKLEGNDSN